MSMFPRLRNGLLTLALASAGSSFVGGCLDRPIADAKPHTSNVYVDQVRQTAIDKIDLLFTIDNSISMADKQEMLGKAVPALLDRLIKPMCENDAGDLVAADAVGLCPDGYAQEFRPVQDIHIGVVSSSLGSHGGNMCEGEMKDDKGQLIASVRSELTSHKGLGFLAWKGQDGGISDQALLVAEFTKHVTATKEKGCGYEATLESWYRFLVDPEPPLTVQVEPGKGAVPVGKNDVLLAQRAAFLRPDSLVAIVMLSDENDCSIVDEGSGYLIASSGVMHHGTSECAVDPNDPCCRSCGLVVDVPNCPDRNADPACQTPASFDEQNLRCHAQKERFGIDLLYPTSRYVNALTNAEVPGRDTSPKPNPLFTNLNGTPRDPSLVFLAGIVGVPWQDLATDATRDAPGALEYMTATELTVADRWKVIVGDPTNHVPPTDPFMIEQPEPRTGLNPIIGVPIVGIESEDPRANPINGHEYLTWAPVTPPDLPVYRDLQYACTYELATPRDCAALPDDVPCDCEDTDIPLNRPLCNPRGGGKADTIQRFGKAYPGLRELEVLKNYALSSKDANSIVASICPKVPIGDSVDSNFGYNPAVRAIIDRLKTFLKGRCLPRPLETDEQGLVPCAVVEAVKGTDCNRPGRVPAPELAHAAIQKQLEESGECGGDCSGYALCEILPAGKSPDGTVDPVRLDACQMGKPLPDEVGYCYIDEAKQIGKPELVKDCPAEERRMLRFIGDDTPTKGALTFIACVGESTS